MATPKGNTSIDSGVVAKIAGMAAREVSGVYNMGAGTARALGAVRGMVGGDKSVTQGVSVEVGERQAAVDLDLVVEYGVAIPDVASAVRRNVITAVERMTGLEVTEVNIKVDDVHMPGQEKDEERAEDSEQGPRVR
ncbi:Asp23/Gls24 family envelope stress response protein [Streptosporangium roseum]|nr:Asp23/Gls24 family envelope stress response protein [Streptosporangium roseum]